MLLRLLFHLFSFIKTEVTSVFGRMGCSENERWICSFLSFRSSFPLDALLRCSAFCSCTLKKDPKFLYFFVSATALTVLVRLTRPKARLTHLNSSQSLAVGLTWVTCVFKWPQSKTSSCVKTGELGATR